MKAYNLYKSFLLCVIVEAVLLKESKTEARVV